MPHKRPRSSFDISVAIHRILAGEGSYAKPKVASLTRIRTILNGGTPIRTCPQRAGGEATTPISSTGIHFSSRLPERRDLFERQRFRRGFDESEKCAKQRL